jgi:hypothetical protein
VRLSYAINTRSINDIPIADNDDKGLTTAIQMMEGRNRQDVLVAFFELGETEDH